MAYESSEDEEKDAFMEEERTRKKLRMVGRMMSCLVLTRPFIQEWLENEPKFRAERERIKRETENNKKMVRIS